MPWKARDTMSLRKEFVTLVAREEAHVAELCRRFGISRQSGYKWLERFQQGGVAALMDQSRRPRHSPMRTSEEVEQKIVQVRHEHPAWGSRKIRRVLINEGPDPQTLPAPSTIGQVLLRRGLIDPQESSPHAPYQRFEHAQPNDLWQMDFKGHVAMSDGNRCHPLTVLDDCSRFNVVLAACGDETAATVRPILISLFQRYGMPWRILCDNGGCWGAGDDGPYSKLSVWLLLAGVQVTHGRPCHPQTQGKDERFHRTLNAELLQRRQLRDLLDAQERFHDWRHVYNHVRPHEALGLSTPITRYFPSDRQYHPDPPPPTYDSGVVVRTVDCAGRVSYQNRPWRIGKAFTGQQVGLRPSTADGVMTVLLGVHEIGTIDARETSAAMCHGRTPVAALPTCGHGTESVNHVPEQLSALTPV